MKCQKYGSEKLARDAAKKAYERVVAVYGKDDCSMINEAMSAKAVMVIHPDRMEGTTTARYEW